ncbi:hypothetical protein QYE76_040138 [Lolium multiflorum]|uniref:Uncharacterized protein n=1 Tax=Lolium multiflorum TaxID=4521 RepID=A0AAD8WST7_LOLMU|nr:hypothetical protein QYE76_040138 [Lolium multiflorum]
MVARPRGRATLWCGRLVDPLRRLFAYKACAENPYERKPRYERFQAAVIAKPRSGDESLCSAPAGRGSAPEGFSIDTAAISTAIFINAACSHEEGVVLHRGSGLYRSNVDPNNVPLASLVAQEENVDVNFIKNNNFNNNAYRNNSGVYPGLEAMLKEFISTQTAFNKSVEEKLDKIDILASRVDRLASDVDLLKLKVMPNKDIDNKITTTANAIQVRINENIRLMAELRARWDREENEKLAKENNVAKVWTITTKSNVDSSHVAAPPTINGKIIGVGNVSTPSAKRTKLPEIAKTAETACDKTAEIFSNLGNNDPIAVAHNDLDFDDCHISEVIKFLQKLAKSPNASTINLAFTKHITNALIKAREEKLKLETSIPRKLEDGWEPIIKMRVNDFDCNALCDLGASISVMPKKVYDMLDLPPLKNCYLDVNLADNAKKKPLGRVDNVHIMVNNNLVPVDFVVLDIECNASCPIILGRPFLRTVGATIDMKKEDEWIEVDDEYQEIDEAEKIDMDDEMSEPSLGLGDDQNDNEFEEVGSIEMPKKAGKRKTTQADDGKAKIAVNTHAVQSNDENLKAMGKAMLDKFDKYWDSTYSENVNESGRNKRKVKNNVMVIATILDPRFHVGAGIPGVAPHYIPLPSTFNVLLGSSWFDKPWFLSEGKLAAVRIIPSSWGSQRTCELHAISGVRTRSKKTVACTMMKRMKTELADSRGTRKV